MNLKRNTFVNQLDPVSGEIDGSICMQNREYGNVLLENDQFLEYQLNSTTSNCNVESLPGEIILSDLNSFKSTDLLSWAFQVAQGMEYVASKNVYYSNYTGFY